MLLILYIFVLLTSSTVWYPWRDGAGAYVISKLKQLSGSLTIVVVLFLD